MRCIFCQKDSSLSVSGEHIVPRSLGHNEHVLRPGIVCDNCNNYLASKVEEPVLSSAFFRDVRFQLGIPSKKGRVPPVAGLMPRAGFAFELRKDGFGISANARKECDNGSFVNALRSGEDHSFWLPVIERIDVPPRLMARFLGKMALECLASRSSECQASLDEIVDHPQLDPLRRFVRLGEGPDWNYTERRIYADDACFHSSDKAETYQVLHEFDLLYTLDKELFFVCTLFGIEFALDMGCPSVDGYSAWLKDNDGQSILLDERPKPHHTAV